MTWNVPDVEANFALRHVPRHGPATFASGGELLGEGCAVGVADGDADADATGVPGSSEGVPLGIVIVAAGVLVASGVGDRGASVNELAVGVGKGALHEQAESVAAVNARTMILKQVRTLPPVDSSVGGR